MVITEEVGTPRCQNEQTSAPMQPECADQNEFEDTGDAMMIESIPDVTGLFRFRAKRVFAQLR